MDEGGGTMLVEGMEEVETYRVVDGDEGTSPGSHSEWLVGDSLEAN